VAHATSPYGVTWNTTTYADGQYDLQVITTDKSGNAPSTQAKVSDQNLAVSSDAAQSLLREPAST
jgi:hypothetical protein